MKQTIAKRMMLVAAVLAVVLGMLPTAAYGATTEIRVDGKTSFDILSLKSSGDTLKYSVTTASTIEANEMVFIDSVPPYSTLYSKDSYTKDYGCVYVNYSENNKVLSITPIKAGSTVLYVAVGVQTPLTDKLVRFSINPGSNIVSIPITVTEEDLGIGYLMINNKSKAETVTVSSSETSKVLNITAMTSGNFLLIPQLATSSEPKVSDVVYPANFTTDYTYFSAALEQSSTGGTLTITPKLTGTGMMKIYLCKTTAHGSLHVINRIMDTFTLSVGVEYTGSTTEKVLVNLANQTYGSSEIALRYGVSESTIQWFSNDISIATVINGRIVGLKQGTTTLTAYLPTASRLVEVLVTVPASNGTVATPTPIPQATNTPGPTKSVYTFKIMASPSLNMRSTPSTTGSKLGGIKKNTVVYGTFYNDDWVLLKAADNASIVQDCYVAAQYLLMQ